MQSKGHTLSIWSSWTGLVQEIVHSLAGLILDEVALPESGRKKASESARKQVWLAWQCHPSYSGIPEGLMSFSLVLIAITTTHLYQVRARTSLGSAAATSASARPATEVLVAAPGIPLLARAVLRDMYDLFLVLEEGPHTATSKECKWVHVTFGGPAP